MIWGRQRLPRILLDVNLEPDLESGLEQELGLELSQVGDCEEIELLN